jgi:hypothetical protein
MDNFIAVQVLESKYDVWEKEFSLLLVEKLTIPNMISQISPVQIIHN